LGGEVGSRLDAHGDNTLDRAQFVGAQPSATAKTASVHLVLNFLSSRAAAFSASPNYWYGLLARR